jgi:hypothetical protein
MKFPFPIYFSFFCPEEKIGYFPMSSLFFVDQVGSSCVLVFLVFPLFLLLGYNSMSSVEDPTDDKLVLRGMKNMKNLNYYIYYNIV